MREIKFRAWDTVERLMVKKIDEIHFIRNIMGGFMSRVIGDDFQFKTNVCVLMQFTGLKDKNGKEIYEGDIVTWIADGINKKAEVIWKDCGWCAKRFDKKLNKFEMYYQFSDFIPVELNKAGKEDMFDGEVIGNIYENPELLNDTLEGKEKQ